MQNRFLLKICHLKTNYAANANGCAENVSKQNSTEKWGNKPRANGHTHSSEGLGDVMLYGAQL